MTNLEFKIYQFLQDFECFNDPFCQLFYEKLEKGGKISEILCERVRSVFREYTCEDEDQQTFYQGIYSFYKYMNKERS